MIVRHCRGSPKVKWGHKCSYRRKGRKCNEFNMEIWSVAELGEIGLGWILKKLIKN